MRPGLQLFCDKNLCRKRDISFYVIYPAVRIRYMIPVFLKIPQQSIRLCITDKGYCYVCFQNGIHGFSISFIKTGVPGYFKKYVDIQAV